MRLLHRTQSSGGAALGWFSWSSHDRHLLVPLHKTRRLPGVRAETLRLAAEPRRRGRIETDPLRACGQGPGRLRGGQLELGNDPGLITMNAYGLPYRPRAYGLPVRSDGG